MASSQIPPKAYSKLDEKAKGERVAAAMVAVRGGMTAYTASKIFDVPRNNLERRARGAQKDDEFGVGRKPAMSPEEEAHLLELIFENQRVGACLSKNGVRELVMHWAEKQTAKGRRLPFNPETGPGDEWFEGLAKRNPLLAKRTADKLDRHRAKAGDADIMNAYFDTLAEEWEREGWAFRPGALYNSDEIGKSVAAHGGRMVVYAEKGSRKVYIPNNALRDHVTVFVTVSGDGKRLPPAFIFAGQRFHADLTVGAPDGSMFVMAGETAYMTSEVFARIFAHKDGVLQHFKKDHPDLANEDGTRAGWILDGFSGTRGRAPRARGRLHYSTL